MTLLQLVLLIFSFSAMLWAAWVWILYSIDPLTTNWPGFLFFYLTLGLALMGTFALLGLFIRHRRHPELLLFDKVVISFRQAVWFSLLSVSLLFLQGGHWLHWWNALPIFAALVVIEAIMHRRSLRRPKLKSEAEILKPLQSLSFSEPRFEKKDL